MAAEKVRVFKVSHESAASLSESAPVQLQNLATSPLNWVGVAHTMAGVASAWHHHDDHDTYGYLISGRLQIEFGPGGKDSAQIGSGEVFHVPKGIIHREVTVGAEPGVVFVVRVGSGEPVVNVDGPEPS